MVLSLESGLPACSSRECVFSCSLLVLWEESEQKSPDSPGSFRMKDSFLRRHLGDTGSLMIRVSCMPNFSIMNLN